jgi:hypothetical protein
MEPDPLDLPTSPSIPPIPLAQPSWPGRSGDQPPSGRPPWTLVAAIGAGLAATLIVALLLTLLLTMRGGTTSVLIGASAEQTATAISAQATATSEGTPPASATGAAGPRVPRRRMAQRRLPQIPPPLLPSTR